MIKIILKFIFAAGVIAWLVNSGKLDFKLIGKLLNHKDTLFISWIFLLIPVFISTYRWKKILEIKTKCSLKFFDILRVNWIGFLFSSILPGAVTGDLIKLVYVRDLNKSLSKSFLLLSILMDRVLGLIGLLFLMGTFSILNYQEITAISPLLKKMIHFNFLIFLGVLLFLIYLFLPTKLQSKILNFSTKIPLVGGKLHRLLEQFWLIGSHKKVVLISVTISIFAQSSAIFAFWNLASPFFDKPLSFIHSITFMPLGFVAIAIPISPAGLGVGHAIFDKLFGFFGVSGGASLFNLYWITYVSNNLLGIIPYTLNKKKHSLDETDEFEVPQPNEV